MPEIAEEGKRLRRAPLLAHEQHGNLRQQEIDRRDRPHCCNRCETGQPIAECPVAHLVVVLDEGNEGGWREVHARHASRAAAKGHQLALKREALRESAAQLPGIALVVGVIALRLAARRRMQHVVDVVVPLCGVPARLAVFAADQAPRLVLFILQNKMDMPAGCCHAYPLGKFLQQVLRAVVEDGVHRIQPQAVEVELRDPVEGVVDHEFAHRTAVRPVEIDRRAPRCLVTIGKGLRRDRVDIGALGTEMVVDDIEQNHQPTGVGGFDQRLQVLGPPVGRIRSERQHPVVAPVPAAGKITDRHDLDCGNAKPDQVVELRNRCTKRALGRKGADVQLVDDRLLPGTAAPAGIAPQVGRRVDDLARPVHVLRLIPRGRVRDAELVRQNEAVSCTGAGAIGDEFVPAPADRLHSHCLAAELDLNLPVGRRPKPEAYPAVVLQFGAEGHVVRARRWGPGYLGRFLPVGHC